MANRFNLKGKTKYGQEPLPSGYATGPTSDFTIPSVGLEDVDLALFSLFDKELPIQVGGSEGSDSKKVPVIFAGGEKWAMLKKNRPLRDKTNSLILPLITIGRTGFTQSENEDITGRGINQKTGEIVIRRRLDKSDRGYQNLINRIFLKHQTDTGVNQTIADPGQLTTIRDVGELSSDPTVRHGGLLLSDRNNNVIETLVVPSPQFITANYEVIIWTQYTHHMNQIMELLISSFLPQTKGWRIDSPKGYWFIAQVSEDMYNSETNVEDMSQDERIIKQKFAIKVPAYIFATNIPGAPVPVKRYVSSPSISFTTGLPIDVSSSPEFTIDDPFLGSDDPTLPLDEMNGPPRRDHRRRGSSRYFSTGEIDENDPALLSKPRGTNLAQYSKIVSRNLSGKLETHYVRIANTNSFTGETSYAPGTDLGGLSIVIIEE